MAKRTLTYQKALDELEDILYKMENNKLEIDQLSSQVKKASELITFCKTKLRETEKDVEDILKDVSKD
jgi:exodeoxyribonuclease VII small subunit